MLLYRQTGASRGESRGAVPEANGRPAKKERYKPLWKTTNTARCAEAIVVKAAAAIIVLANRDMFFETRHVGRLLEAENKNEA